MTGRTTSPSAKSQTARLYLRMPADVKATLRHAADLSGQSLSELVVNSALAAAEKTIQEHEVIVLSERDSITFFEAILNPEGPNEALLKAMRDHREMFGPFGNDDS